MRGARHAIDAPGGYAEVRYEVLRSAGSPEIIRVFDAIGIDLSNEAAEALLAREAVTTTRPSDNAVGARTITTSPNRNAEIRVGGMFAEFSDGQEPDGFAGKATSGSWKQWTPSERYEFDEAAGDLLVELGYEPDRSWAGSYQSRRGD